MSTLEILPVRTAQERRTFLTFPWRIYRDDPLWVPPLLPERAKTIDPERGAFFKRSVYPDLDRLIRFGQAGLGRHYVQRVEHDAVAARAGRGAAIVEAVARQRTNPACAADPGIGQLG